MRRIASGPRCSVGSRRLLRACPLGTAGIRERSRGSHVAACGWVGLAAARFWIVIARHRASWLSASRLQSGIVSRRLTQERRLADRKERFPLTYSISDRDTAQALYRTLLNVSKVSVITKGKDIWLLRYCRPRIPALIALSLSSVSIVLVVSSRFSRLAK
jgi:hypothetical protein